MKNKFTRNLRKDQCPCRIPGQSLFQRARLAATAQPSRWILCLLLAAAALQLGACKKYLDVGIPKTQLAASAVFETDATATAVLSAAYTRLGGISGGANGGMTNMGAYLADETDSYTATVALVQLANNQLIPSNTYSTGIWNGFYDVIYQCNVLLEGLRDNPRITPSVSKQLRGEALFLRAFSHLSLAGLFGEVPLITQSDYRINALASRSPMPAVYAQVIGDLSQAKELLGESYSAPLAERIYANRWAATALLARTYLYSGDYAKARTEASALLAQTSLFALVPPAEVFLKNSKESILQYKPVGTFATSEGNMFVLLAKPTQLALSPGFLSRFEPADLRKSTWTAKIASAGVDYFFPYKYKVKSASTLTEYSVLLRLGEQYLIRAEASARLGDHAQALSDLDALRSRAGLAKLSTSHPTLSTAALLAAVLTERKHELFTEWNHRWMDLQRFGQAALVLPMVKPDWKASALLLPVPETDLRNNPNLTQNPGYQ